MREGAEPGTLSVRGILGGHQCGTSPFTAQPQTLSDAEDAQQQRRPEANALIVGQQADGNGGKPHQQQRGHQRLLAADAVTKVPEQRRTDGTRQEGQRQRGQRQQHRHVFIALVEELGIEDQHCGSSVDVVVVELDGGSHHRGNGDLVGIVSEMRDFLMTVVHGLCLEESRRL